MKFVELFFAWIKPPGLVASQEEQFAWRMSMSFSVGILTAAFVAQITWNMGLTPFSEGMATQHSVNSVVTEVRSYRAQDMVVDMLNVRTKQCAAHGELKDLLTQQLTQMLIEYKQIKDADFPLPACQND